MSRLLSQLVRQGTGIVPGRGGAWSHGVQESSFLRAISTGFEGEDRATQEHSLSFCGGSLATSAAWVHRERRGMWPPAGPWLGWVAQGHCDNLTPSLGPAPNPWGSWVAPGGPGMGTVLLSHAGTWHMCTLDWHLCSGPTRLIIMPPVGGTFP